MTAVSAQPLPATEAERELVPATGSVGFDAADSRRRRYEDIRQLIANVENPTPLVRVRRVLNRLGPADLALYLKLEWMNPFGSIKDRTAAYLLQGLADRGELDGRELVEPSSGNTGIALAALAALEQRKLVVTIPDGVPEEKKTLLRMLGAEVLATPDELCPVDHPKDGAIALARSIAESEGGERYLMPDQYSNADNVRAHYETTGPEIWRQTEGRVRYFFAGFGTCGTLTGVGRFLKEQDPSIQIIAVEPQRGHRLPGLKNFEEAKEPAILDRSVIDEVIRVDDEPAYAMTRRLFREEALIVGPSTGAIVEAVKQFAGEHRGLAVGVSPDGGLKYMSYFAELLAAEERATTEPVGVASRLDCAGDICPLPIYKTTRAMAELEPGEVLEIVTTDPAAEADFRALARRKRHQLLSVEEADGRQTFLLRKGARR